MTSSLDDLQEQFIGVTELSVTSSNSASLFARCCPCIISVCLQSRDCWCAGTTANEILKHVHEVKAKFTILAAVAIRDLRFNQETHVFVEVLLMNITMKWQNVLRCETRLVALLLR